MTKYGIVGIFRVEIRLQYMESEHIHNIDGGPRKERLRLLLQCRYHDMQEPANTNAPEHRDQTSTGYHTGEIK